LVYRQDRAEVYRFFEFFLYFYIFALRFVVSAKETGRHALPASPFCFTLRVCYSWEKEKKYGKQQATGPAGEDNENEKMLACHLCGNPIGSRLLGNPSQPGL
jgi:hypothetical protein